MSINPRPNETPTEYFDRMLGPQEMRKRFLGNSSSYQYYLLIWDTYYAQKRKALEHVHQISDVESPERATG